MSKPNLRAVEKGEQLHPRELDRRIIRERAEQLPGGVAQIHDPKRKDLNAPAPALPDVLDKATYQIPAK